VARRQEECFAMPITLEDIGQVHDTEVLILGSGAAGCGAALAATEACARVMLVDKGKLESSGCLGGGNDHFMAILDTDPVTDTTDVAVDFFAVPASGFSRAMVRQ
jgi:flavin-dependent dehydrogenase